MHAYLYVYVFSILHIRLAEHVTSNSKLKDNLRIVIKILFIIILFMKHLLKYDFTIDVPI